MHTTKIRHYLRKFSVSDSSELHGAEWRSSVVVGRCPDRSGLGNVPNYEPPPKAMGYTFPVVVGICGYVSPRHGIHSYVLQTSLG